MQPRIHISYDIEENGKTIKKTLPFSVGVVGDFVGNASPYASIPFKDRSFIPINKSNISSVMSQLEPNVRFSIEYISDNTKSSLPIHLTFNSIDDFKPDAIIQQVPLLKKLWELRQQLKQLQIENLTKKQPINDELIALKDNYNTLEK